MTNQEAAKMISNDMKLHYDDLSEQYRKALNIAIDALLKEQEAKLVRIDKDSVHCPSCGNELFTYPRQKFCDECGQAVKWDD